MFHNITEFYGTVRLAVALWIMPKDVSRFVVLILSKMADDIQKLDTDKRNKISALKIDFEFRD